MLLSTTVYDSESGQISSLHTSTCSWPISLHQYKQPISIFHTSTSGQLVYFTPVQVANQYISHQYKWPISIFHTSASGQSVYFTPVQVANQYISHQYEWPISLLHTSARGQSVYTSTSGQYNKQSNTQSVLKQLSN